jgi:hypothetical protein
MFAWYVWRFNAKLLTSFLDRADVEIDEHVFTVISNKYDGMFDEMLTILLDRRGDTFQVPGNIVQTIAAEGKS